MRMCKQAHAHGQNVQKFHLTGRLGQDLPLGQRRLMIEGIIGLLWGTGSDRTLTFRHNQTTPPHPTQAQSVRVLPPSCVEPFKALSKGDQWLANGTVGGGRPLEVEVLYEQVS